MRLGDRTRIITYVFTYSGNLLITGNAINIGSKYTRLFVVDVSLLRK